MRGEAGRGSIRFKGEVSLQTSRLSLSLSLCGRTGSILKSDSRGKEEEEEELERGKNVVPA